MIYRNYSKSVVKNWIETVMLITNCDNVNSSKYITHYEDKEYVFLIETLVHGYSLFELK